MAMNLANCSDQNFYFGTYQIQTLVGENNIWSDSGNISVLNITCNADFLETFLKMKLIGDC